MYVELSYPIGEKLTALDAGLKPPQVVPRSRVAEGRSSNTSYIELFAHTGTHIDAPWHFNEDGRRILDFEIGEFVFSNVLLVDVPKGDFDPVTREDLAPYEGQIAGADALLIRTSFSAKRDGEREAYIHHTPGLAVEAARFLAGFPNLRCIGVDFISIENVDAARKTGFPVHHILLDRSEPMILLEDANLVVVEDRQITRLFLFPLRIEALEASPVTAVAEV